MLELKSELDAGIDKEYKVGTIQDSIVYNEVMKDQLPKLYYLISWNSYLKNDNTWEQISVVM